jgi:hypothetical protein
MPERRSLQSLLPTIDVIHDELTRNERERAALRTLLMLREREEREQRERDGTTDRDGGSRRG